MASVTPAIEESNTQSFSDYKREQARISERGLIPVTVFYGIFAVIMLVLGWRTAHPIVAIIFFLLGAPMWSLVEYGFHRYILHGRFPAGKGLHNWFLHEVLDPLHWGHHENPFDGDHMHGDLKDLIPLFAVALPVSFIFPTYTAPMLLAGTIIGYVSEEWLHHCMHYYNFKNAYFRYVKRYHLYHHSSKGDTRGFGITSGVWDIVFDTRFPENIRDLLAGRRKAKV